MDIHYHKVLTSIHMSGNVPDNKQTLGHCWLNVERYIGPTLFVQWLHHGRPNVGMLLKMVGWKWSQCEVNVETMWRQCGYNMDRMEPMWSQCGEIMWSVCWTNVKSMWEQCEVNVGTMWGQCGENVKSMWEQCEVNVGTMWSQCGNNVEPMSNQCLGNVDVMWSQWGANVESMWNYYGTNIIHVMLAPTFCCRTQLCGAYVCLPIPAMSHRSTLSINSMLSGISDPHPSLYCNLG